LSVARAVGNSCNPRATVAAPAAALRFRFDGAKESAMEDGDACEANPGAVGPGESGARLIGRLILGSAVFGGERLVQALQLLDRTPGLPPPSAPSRASWRHVLIGGALESPRWVRRGLARTRPLSRAAARSVVQGWRAVRWLPGAEQSERWFAARRQRAAEWAELGRREEGAARALAQSAGLAFVELALAVVADSPDVRKVIEEQSTGLAQSALEDTRDRSQRADALAERVARRLLRRPPASGP
jgi:hypothetical protein